MGIMDGMYETQASITSMLSCTEAEQVSRVTQLLEEKRNREREIKSLNEKLCVCQTKEVMDECKASGGNLAVVDLGDVDMGYMTMLSTSVLEKSEGGDTLVLLFVGGEDGSDEGSFLLVGNKEIVDTVGKKLAELFGGRGGGRNGKFQGKGTKIRSAMPDVKKFLVDEINA